MLFVHKKTEKLYRLIAFGTDATNVRDGVQVVVYCPVNDKNRIFVREQFEFYKKFIHLDTNEGGRPNGQQ